MGQPNHPAFRLDAKTAKTNGDKTQLFKDNYKYFYPPEDPDYSRLDMDDDHDLSLWPILTLILLLG